MSPDTVSEAGAGAEAEPEAVPEHNPDKLNVLSETEQEVKHTYLPHTLFIFFQSNNT